MKRVIILSFIVALLTSCVSKQRETELLGKISELEKQLDDCQNGAEKLHAKMKLYFEKGEFQLCKNVYSEMEKRHPDSELYSEVKSLYEKLIKDEQEKAERERFLAEKKALGEKFKVEKDILEKELQFFDQPFDAYSHCNTEADLQNILGMFSAWSALIEAREKSENTEIQKLATQLRVKVVDYQAKSFPIFRKEYLKLIDNKVTVYVDKLGVIGGSDMEYVDIQANGNKYTNAICSWWGLVSDKNKVIFERKYFDTFAILRFKKVKLQYNSDDAEPSYFIPFKGNDNDLIVLK